MTNSIQDQSKKKCVNCGNLPNQHPVDIDEPGAGTQTYCPEFVPHGRTEQVTEDRQDTEDVRGLDIEGLCKRLEEIPTIYIQAAYARHALRTLDRERYDLRDRLEWLATRNRLLEATITDVVSRMRSAESQLRSEHGDDFHADFLREGINKAESVQLDGAIPTTEANDVE